jgi:hypothetical protein
VWWHQADAHTNTSRLRTQHITYIEPAPRGGPPRQPSPKAFAAFGLRANSLLLYQHVFKGAVGEALLGLMAASQKYQVCVWGGRSGEASPTNTSPPTTHLTSPNTNQASNKDIIGAYTKFYSLLLLSGYECWRDYVLDQVLLGR